MQVKLVLALTRVGMIEPSTTRRFSTPWTRPSLSTTAPSEGSGSHGAGAGRVGHAGGGGVDPLVELLVVVDGFLVDVDCALVERLHRVGLGQIPGEPRALAEADAVGFVLVEFEVDVGVVGVVGAARG